MSSSDRTNWTILLLVGLVDICWLSRTNFGFTGVWLGVALIATLVAIALWCRHARRYRSLGETAHYLAMWLSLMALVGILSYLAASLGAPLQDDAFVRLDAALGFDWQSFSRWLGAHQTVAIVLELAYFSFLLQIFGTIGYFSLTGQDQRNREFLSMLLLSSLIVVAVSGIVPALGPWDHFGIKVSPLIDHVPHVKLLRAGVPATFEIHDMKGLVTFPSFHTVAALLLIHVHRCRRWLFVASVMLNGLMLISVPPMGSHYLVDVLAGAVVAGLAIAVIRAGRQPVEAPRADASAASPAMEARS
jgi:hypothetical protein